MMTAEEKIAFCIKVGNGLKGAKVYYREDWDCYYFDLVGKYFGLLSDKSENGPFITLKNSPEVNEELRETYSFVRPGYYTSKAHWNSIDLTSEEVTEAILEEFIKISYQLIFDKLTKKVKATII